jgi:hypothetical protein
VSIRAKVQQILHESARALGLPAQQQQQPVPVGHVGVARLLQDRFGGGGDPGDRRAQLVGGVGDKTAHALRGGQRPAFRPLERVQHFIEGGRRPAQLGVGDRRPEPLPPSAAGDAAGQPGHRIQR